MSLNKTVYPPQSFPFQISYPYNVTGIAISVLAIQIKNPNITAIATTELETPIVAALATVVSVAVA